METNKMIAEFMGIKLKPNECGRLFRYHKEWNWLMPVANEIIKSRDEQNTDWDLTDLKYALQTTNINLVYQAIIDFIDWHDFKKQ